MGEETEPEARTNDWLAERVALLRAMHFADVPQGYPIVTYFGMRAKYRFGSICGRNGTTIIKVNPLFADPFVPTYVVDGTLAHELAHYAHGFGSGLPRRYAHAHRGGVVDRELAERGLGGINDKAAQWRETYWEAFYESRCHDVTTRQTARHASAAQRWSEFLRCVGNRSEAELQGRLALLAAHLPLAGEVAGFAVEWLRATPRQQGLSYWFAAQGTVRLHGLLADRRVPGVVVDFELAYWLARRRVGERWQAIHAVLCAAGLADVAEEALRWRRHAWTRFRTRHHPLRDG